MKASHLTPAYRNFVYLTYRNACIPAEHFCPNLGFNAGLAHFKEAIMNIHVANLSVNVIESDLVRLFSVYGSVDFVVIVRDQKNGRSLGNAFIEMPLQAQGDQAIRALNDSEIDGLKISVREIEFKAGECDN